MGHFHVGPVDLLQNGHGNLGVGLVVLGHEDAAAFKGKVVGLLLLLRHEGGAVPHGQVKVYGERAAPSGYAVHHDLAPHQPYQLVGDGHAQTGAAVCLGNGGVLLLEGAENGSDEFGVHAFTGVFYGDQEADRVICAHHLAEGDGYLTMAGEFYRVG